MPKNISKTEAQKDVEEFFLNVRIKSPKEIKKLKHLAMNKKIPLKEYRKLFCKNCLIPFSGTEKIRIKNKIKSIECTKCGRTLRWYLSK